MMIKKRIIIITKHTISNYMMRPNPPRRDRDWPLKPKLSFPEHFEGREGGRAAHWTLPCGLHCLAGASFANTHLSTRPKHKLLWRIQAHTSKIVVIVAVGRQKVKAAPRNWPLQLIQWMQCRALHHPLLPEAVVLQKRTRRLLARALLVLPQPAATGAAATGAAAALAGGATGCASATNSDKLPHESH